MAPIRALSNMKRRKEGRRSVLPEKKPRRMSDRIKGKERRDLNVTPPHAVIMNAGNADFPPEDRAFAIDLILSKILLCMSMKELKTCLLVSPRWNYSSLRTINKRKPFQLCGLYKEDDCTDSDETNDNNPSAGFRYALMHNQERTEKTLEDLTKIMETSYGFPCSHFCFQDGSLNDPSLQKFLNSHGANIKRLCVNVHSSGSHGDTSTPSLATLKKLLTVQAPNLERLRLDEFPRKWKSISYNSKNFLVHANPNVESEESNDENTTVMLPALKILELPEDTPQRIFNEFVQVANNLNQLDLVNGKVDFFIQAKKLHLLKNFYFAPSAETLPSYEIISKENLQLQKIEFFISYRGIEVRQDLWSRVVDVLYRLLEKNAGTLQTIKWKPMGFLNDLSIPVLKNVKKLKIEEDVHIMPPAFHSRNKRIFPRGLSLSKVFPNLETVSIDISDIREEHSTSQYFDSNYDPIPTVKYISIDQAHNYSPAFMNLLFPQIFPNAISGKFCRLGRPLSQGIWKFMQLEQLELSFDIGCLDDPNNKPYSIDPFFTGISEENCIKLNKSKILNTSNRKLRVNPSIVDLKHLRQLKIRFYDTSEFERLDDEQYALQLTNLIGRYGFKLCPELHVTVSVDAEDLQNVSPLKDYVFSLRPFVQAGPW